MRLAAVAVACLLLLGALGTMATASSSLRRGRDVPAGQCFNCEITCFEDCALKFDREILGTWGFLEKETSSASPLDELREKSLHGYSGVRGTDIISSSVAQLKQAGKSDSTCDKRRGCSAAEHCRQKTVQNDFRTFMADFEAREEAKEEDILEKGYHSTPVGKSLALASKRILPLEGSRESFYPKHSVKIGVFEKGGLKLDQCLTYCLSSTCGCYVSVAGAEGPKAMEKHNKKNTELGSPVFDTKPSWHYRAAKKEECGDGIKKVTSGLFVDFAFGTGGWLEVCTKKFWYHVYGSATHKDFPKWKDGCSNALNMDWGCFWRGGRCEVGNRKYSHLLCTTRDRRETFDTSVAQNP